MLISSYDCYGSLFNLKMCLLLMQVRRGADRAEIQSLAFSSAAQWLAVSSDKGTVHVFSLSMDSGALGNDRPRSTSEANLSNPSAIKSLSFMKGNIYTLVIYYGLCVDFDFHLMALILSSYVIRCAAKIFQLRMVSGSIPFE